MDKKITTPRDIPYSRSKAGFSDIPASKVSVSAGKKACASPADVVNPVRRGTGIYGSPVCFIGFGIDRSGSVDSIWDDIKACLFATLASMMNNPVLRRAAKITIVAFDSEVEVIADQVPLTELNFAEIDAKLGKPRGITRMGEAIVRTVSALRAAAVNQNKTGRHVLFQSLFSILTDGLPSLEDGSVDEDLVTMAEAYALADELLPMRKVVILPCSIGDDPLQHKALKRLVEADSKATVHVVKSKEDLSAYFEYVGMTANGFAGGHDPRTDLLNSVPTSGSAMGDIKSA